MRRSIRKFNTPPPRAAPRAFELLKVVLFKFLPLGARTASSTGFSKAKRARILTREEGSRASAERERGDWKRAKGKFRLQSTLLTLVKERDAVMTPSIFF